MRAARRRFLKRGAGGLFLATTLASLAARANPAVRGTGAGRMRWARAGRGYGALRRAKDQAGREILALPEGFTYVTFSRTGDPMSDGAPTPANPDGMAAFAMPGGLVRLIRNHEIASNAGNNILGVQGDPATRYDPLAFGGCVSVDFDPVGMRVVRDFVSINGTLMNCAGGLAYQDAGWLTCEETLRGPAEGYGRAHGYIFMVGRDLNASRLAEPFRAMGRFAHEAAVAAADGVVYETEDAGTNSGFYRFVPVAPADLARGGTLQMLAVQGRPNYDTRFGQVVGAPMQVEWVTIDRPDPTAPGDSCFAQGLVKGGARFARLEGIHRGEGGSIYFVSTSGGNLGFGQIWQYKPGNGGGELALRYESVDFSELESPDNLTVTPSGALLLCEDDATPNNNDRHGLASEIANVNRLVGLYRDGRPFDFAVNVSSASEFTGACFSPDGEFLFVNIQGGVAAGSGMTCAITGPWERGAL